MPSVYDLTLHGYDPATDATDDRVKWIAAESLDYVRRFIQKHELGGLVLSLDTTPQPGHLGFDDGVDVVIAANGDESVNPYLSLSVDAVVSQWRTLAASPVAG